MNVVAISPPFAALGGNWRAWLVLTLALACAGALSGIACSRWARSRPLVKYTMFSLVAHVVVLIAAYWGDWISFPSAPEIRPVVVRIHMSDDDEAEFPEPQPGDSTARLQPDPQVADLPETGTADAAVGQEFPPPPDLAVADEAALDRDLDQVESEPEPADNVERPAPSAAHLTPPAERLQTRRLDAGSGSNQPSLRDLPVGAENRADFLAATEDQLGNQPEAELPHTATPAPMSPPKSSSPPLPFAALENPETLPERPSTSAAIPLPTRSIEQRSVELNASSRTAAMSGTRGVRLDNRAMPPIYRPRFAPNRDQHARQVGGSPAAEAAVEAALQWLAEHQSADGRWDAKLYEAGRGIDLDGQQRYGAGIHADTGVTGLSLLALLGAGHTHIEAGPYQAHVRRGLEFLTRIQHSRDGNLAGEASVFAAMYCHGIATLALSEAYGLTGDDQLKPPLSRALQYTLAAQHPAGGGWRYRPGEAGDMSQFGWQLMSLHSASTAGIGIPPTVWKRAHQFLDEVSAGPHKGLASYRPNERPSPAMTAESLLCRLYLAVATDDPGIQEGAAYLVQKLPGPGTANFYYWYYATLALFQLQDHHWQTWNAALQTELLARQLTDGDLAGSWPPTTVYGRSGGRVYTTALAALMLEVYYRYQRIARAEADVSKAVSGW